MNLHSGAPYWLLRNGLPPEYPPTDDLDRDDLARVIEVVVVGAGITGAFVADTLARDGVDVVVLDARAPGGGSTAASTALLQYELDTEFLPLAQALGNDAARLAYRAASDAVETVADACASLDDDCAFARRTSLYLATRRRDGLRLAAECAARREIGLSVSVCTAAEVQERYGFRTFGALESNGAEVDPMRLTTALLSRATRAGARVFGRTRVVAIRRDAHARDVEVQLANGRALRARRVVMATGYEAPLDVVRPFVRLHSSFAIATEPLKDWGRWDDRSLVWETRRPYFYMRTTPDDRIVAGGADIPFHDETARDALLPIRRRRLGTRLAELVPDVELEIAYAWTGTFGETVDGLPYVGELPELPGVLFALGYGGNGITFGALAATLLGASLRGETHPLLDLLGFGRVSLRL